MLGTHLEFVATMSRVAAGMWIVWTALGLVSAVVIVALLTRSRPAARPKRLRQPDTEGVDHGELPEPGSDEVSHRRDGGLMPGSEEYRNRQGKS